MSEENCAMMGCMRYWVSSSSASTPPAVCSCSNRLTPSPSCAAFWLMTVGGSCMGSPAITTHMAPFISGIRVAGSVAWVASSMTTTEKVRPSRERSPTPTQVPTTTSALLRMSARAASSYSRASLSSPEASARICIASPVILRDSSSAAWSRRRSAASRRSMLCRPHGCCSSCPSTVAARSSSLTLTGIPILTTLMPISSSPSRMLSAAMFESEHARTCPLSPLRRHTSIKRRRVRVLPVPGGPCQRVSRRDSAVAMAWCWESLRSSPTIASSLKARSRHWSLAHGETARRAEKLSQSTIFRTASTGGSLVGMGAVNFSTASTPRWNTVLLTPRSSLQEVIMASTLSAVVSFMASLTKFHPLTITVPSRGRSGMAPLG
mmetsp:Transcript_31888/g.101597  ORF Transcript_31888/g.101597 Transcript_31888/m.101597 type:complete len:378 (+) Transcript_31888:694-1827(+)